MSEEVFVGWYWAGVIVFALAIFVYILDGLGWILYYKSILLGPITIVGARMASGRPSPRLGEHSEEILREIGMEPDAVPEAPHGRPARSAVSG